MKTSSLIVLSMVALYTLLHSAEGQSRPNKNRRTTEKATTLSESEEEASASGQVSVECPESDGFFADQDQCDKYHECRNGAVVAEKLCPDGMIFNDFSPVHEKCDLPFNLDCSKRPKLQPPQPALHCPRQNGYFAHEDDKICNQFYYCVDGKFNKITCPDGLVYSSKTGICTWPDEAKKKHCSSQELFKFACPQVETSVAQTHPRYPDPENCQYFYVCINGETPRRSGCKMGQVFNDVTGACDWPRHVPDCVDWYKGILTEEELYELENPKPKVRDPVAAGKRQKNKRPTTTSTPEEN